MNKPWAELILIKKLHRDESIKRQAGLYLNQFTERKISSNKINDKIV
jgi:hypothetical protein